MTFTGTVEVRIKDKRENSLEDFYNSRIAEVHQEWTNPMHSRNKSGRLMMFAQKCLIIMSKGLFTV